MSYEIKNYEDGFIDKQVEIGNIAYKGWQGAGQTSVENLKKTYSSENPSFDPNTKFYAFLDDKMVGFVTASIQAKKEDEQITARLEFPLVLPEYENARDELFKAALKGLKEKGVNKIQSRAGKNWGYTLEFANSKGYKLLNLLSKSAEFNISDIEILTNSDGVEAFDREKDIDIMIDTFIKFYNLKDENQIKGLKQQIIELPNTVNIIAENIVRDGDLIVGRQLIFTRGEDSTINFGSMVITAENKEEIQQKLLSAAISKIKGTDHTNCRIQLFGNFEEGEKPYASLNLEYQDGIAMYELDI